MRLRKPPPRRSFVRSRLLSLGARPVRPSSDMPPGIASQNVADRDPTDTEPIGDGLLREGACELTDKKNVAFRQFGVLIRLSGRSSGSKIAKTSGVSPFCDSVLCVCRRIPNEQMARTHAPRVVTAVTNQIVARNIPDVTPVTKPVGSHGAMSVPKRAVSVYVCPCFPFPARTKFGAVSGNRPRFVDLFPEALFNGLFHCGLPPRWPPTGDHRGVGKGREWADAMGVWGIASTLAADSPDRSRSTTANRPPAWARSARGPRRPNTIALAAPCMPGRPETRYGATVVTAIGAPA